MTPVMYVMAVESCYDGFMKQTTIEPGILQVLKWLAVLQVLGIVAFRLAITSNMDIALPREIWLAAALPVPLLLLVFTWIPWFHQNLRHNYISLILVMTAINFILEKYLTLA